jgi:hypothetical protein
MSHDFDSLDAIDSKRAETPLWALDLDDEKNERQILEWLNSELKYLEKENEERIRACKHNLARYKGIQYQTMDTRIGNRDREAERAKFSPKLVVNLLAQAVEQRVARLAKFRPAVAIMPANDEYQDKLSSKIAKTFLDYIQYSRRFETKNLTSLRVAEICGEAYMDICWNPDLGELHPDYDEETKEPLLDANGKEVMGSDGKPVMIESPVYVGDVDYKVILPMFLFFEKKDSWDESNYVFHIERVPTAELRKEYPEKADQIKSDSTKSFYNVAKLQDEKLDQETIKITLQYKKSKFMPKGRWIVFTKDVILENTKQKYDHGEFTFERLICNEIPGEQHAVSFFENAKALNASYNNLTNMIVRNQNLVAHPKWFVPKGSVKLESLGNDITIAQYTGGQPPILAQQNPTPAEVFNFRQQLKDEFMQQAQLGDVMRGDPPQGIVAGVALQFLAEQEASITNAQVVQYNEYIRRVASKTVKVAAQYYDPSDKRTIMVLGQSQNWVSHSFDPKHLARPFDIRIQNSSALPDSKAARTQFILDYAERFPTAFPEEQVAEMLDLGQRDKFLNETALAARASEYENEKMLNGESVEPPVEWEMHIVHWKNHLKVMQDPAFKSSATPESVREALKDHMLATEMLMIEAAQRSPMMAQQLQALSQFPIFYVLPPPPQPEPPMPPEGQPPMGDEQMMAQTQQPPLSAVQGDMGPPDQLPPSDLDPEPMEQPGELMNFDDQVGFSPV